MHVSHASITLLLTVNVVKLNWILIISSFSTDSVSSHHHDSAYDSTDPDGDGEAGESVTSTHEEYGSSSSSSSLSPSTANSSWSSDAVFDAKPPFNRRCSEPIILRSADLEILRSHARSQDDCSMKRMENFNEQPLKKQISDDSFLLKRQGGAQSVLHFPKLSSSTNMDQLPYMRKDCSCSSLESTASNQSDVSVFTHSPLESPSSSRRANTTSQPSVAPKAAQQDIARPISDAKKRSQSFRVVPKVLLRTRSLGAFSRNSLKKDSHKESSFPCETLQEDSQSEADTPTEPSPKQRPLSAIEVFEQADRRLTPRPPSYHQAVQNACHLPEYRAMTVQDALEQRRPRPSSVNYEFPVTYPVNQHMFNQDCLGQAEQEPASVVERRQPFRQRAMSESVFAGRHEMVSRRCSQPVFEELSHAKESYV